MARINIEECWWTDPRRSALAERLGSEDLADAAAIRAWRLGQEFWKHERKLVPKHIFQVLKSAQALLACGLVTEKDEGFYVRGSCSYLDWALEKRSAGRKGGAKSALRPRNAKGQLLKFAQAVTKQAPSKSQTEPKHSQASSSSSSSSSEEKDKEPIANAIGSELALAPASGNLPEGKSRKSKYSDLTRHKMRGFFEAYADRYKAKYGGSPECIRDPILIGKVGNWIEHVSEDRARNLIEVYCQIDYRPINESQHDLWQFFRNLNRIGNALSSGADPGGIDWSQVFAGAPR